MIWDKGLMIATEELVGPIDLLMEYGDQYDWDDVKWLGFEAIRKRATEIEPREGEWINA